MTLTLTQLMRFISTIILISLRFSSHSYFLLCISNQWRYRAENNFYSTNYWPTSTNYWPTSTVWRLSQRKCVAKKIKKQKVTIRIRVTQSLVFCVCFVDRCSSFFPLAFGHCVVCSSSFGHCVVCSSSFGHCVVCSSSFGHCVVCSSSFGHCVVCSSSFGHCDVYSSSFGHCVVCSSSIYRFWLPLWYLHTLLKNRYKTGNELKDKMR